MKSGVWTSALVALCLTAAAAAKDYIETDYLGDGEREVRIKFGRVHAKQTAMEVVEGNVIRGLHLWQVTDGRHFIQSIFTASGELKDCEYIRRKDVIASFLAGFEEGAERAQLLAAFGPAEGAAQDRGSAQEMRNATFRLLTEAPKEYEAFLNYKEMKRACRQHHKLIKRVAHKKQHGTAEEKADAEAYISRQKRDIRFIFPGTKWCGDGSVAESRAQIGGLHSVDRCCRSHDYCPYIIKGLSENYGLFNFRLFTMSHCHCDQRFHTCLKMTGSGAANMVGKIFFNVVKTKCFVLKKQVECIKSSWWGNECEEKRIVKRAALKDALEY